MTVKSELLARFTGQNDGQPVYLPDLSLWYAWYQKQGTLPEKWSHHSLPQIAQEMGVPVWMPVRPWCVKTPGMEVVVTQGDDERVVRVNTSQGELISRWMLGPDGDWWQTEYPVKSNDDLAAALEWVRAREYVLDDGDLIRLDAEVGQNGLIALEIPRRPYTDLLHDLLGWSDGLMLLGEPEIQEILELLAAKLHPIIGQISQLPGDVILAPENLDGQFISPRVFDRYFADSYRVTVEILDRPLLVHVGGPVSRLLARLSSVGVSGAEGVCGPPQGDTTLFEARSLAGPAFTLWGGIPQDILTDVHLEVAFEESVRQAVRESSHDGRVILGIADRVPPFADLNRLERLPALIAQGV